MTNFNIADSENIPQSFSDDNILDQLKKIISKSVTRPDIFIAVPDRPGVSLRISPNVTQGQLRSWRKSAGEDTKNGLNTLKFSAHVIAATTTGILLNEEFITDSNGTELTFGSPEIMAMTNTNRPHPDCVVAFFGTEPHVEAVTVVIIESAGYGDQIETLDPTKGSSEN